jgi:hypothetical protein
MFTVACAPVGQAPVFLIGQVRIIIFAKNRHFPIQTFSQKYRINEKSSKLAARASLLLRIFAPAKRLGLGQQR